MSALIYYSMAEIEAQRLALERARFDFIRQQAEHADQIAAEIAARAMDFEYLKLAVILILLIIIVFYLSCRFGFGIPKKKPSPPPAISAPPKPVSTSAPAPAVSAAPVAKKERFSPYASILTPDIQRTDANFDSAQNMPYKDFDYNNYDEKTYNLDLTKQSSEDRLFSGVHELIL